MPAIAPNVAVATLTSQQSTREDGRKALAQLQPRLAGQSPVTLDFSAVTLTPSFAEELLGGLAAQLGLAEFKRRVVLQNIDESARPLVRRVVLNRASRPT